MAFNAAISAYGNALSVQGTPTKDRDRHPFPASVHPSPAPSLRQTGSSSASASFTNLPSTATSSAQVSPQSTTVEALLKQHASSPDPKAAALDQAVADRNVLSGQNTQLWKLIEKQRAGYNQILKELERIRGERDSYKNKLVSLNALPNGSSDRRQKNTSQRGSRPSLDTTSSHTSSSSLTISHSQARLPPRQNSDDTGIFIQI
jgi:RalA-binding protein 1